jgi:hypothetical protein
VTTSRFEQAAARISWRRVTISIGLEVFAGAALWFGKLDPETWAWFSGGIASMYIGGDTLEKVATLISAVKSTKKESSDG